MLVSLVVPNVNDFRLTTESGVPDSTSDRTSQGTIYLTPFKGNCISLYTGSVWQTLFSAEVSLVLSGLTSGKNYDVFAYDNSGTLTLELSAAWTNDTTRADAIALQDGVWVKSGSATKRWIGTIRTTGTATTEDSERRRFVYNWSNQIPRRNAVAYATSHAYGTNTTRQVDLVSTNQIEYVIGAPQTSPITLLGSFSNTFPTIAAGLDSTSSETFFVTVQSAGSGIQLSLTQSRKLAIGYHFWSLNERAGAGTSCTFCVFSLPCSLDAMLMI